MSELKEVQQLRDEALIERLSMSVRTDRRLTARLLVEMAEVQVRGLYRDLGYSSMFDFATRKLAMSEGEASLRIRAAKVGRSFPDALEMLSRCEVNLTTLSLLAPVLDHDSIHLLYAARGKSKLQVQALIAVHAPKPDAPDSVRRLPRPRASARAQRLEKPSLESQTLESQTLEKPSLESQTLEKPRAHATTVVPAQPRDVHACTNQSRASQPSAAAVAQLSAERHKFTFTGSRRVRELLREAQDLRRHGYPAGDLEPLFERALELLVAEEKKHKFALTAKPRAAAAKKQPENSRYIPHPVRRDAWTRDAGQCCFVTPDGVRCQSRSRLEFHHVVPFARGGTSSADNIVLFCQAHNMLQAERDYGRTFVRECAEAGSSGNGPTMIPRGGPPPSQVQAATHQPQAP